MPGEIIIEGSLKWIIPLLIVISTAAFTLYTIAPTIEFFVEKSIETNTKTKKKIKSDDLDETKEENIKENINDEYEIGKGEIDNLEEIVTELKKKLEDAMEQRDKKKNEGKKTEIVKPVNPSYKENFVTYTNSAEILRPNWRKESLPRTLERYNGQIQGYNCGEYSDFTITPPKSSVRNKPCNNKYITPPTGQSDYIFPGRKVNKSNCIKYASKPHILGYESDVNKKILEYESMNILPEYNPNTVASLDRPQYIYHRKDGIDDPIITDENRFELGELNVFNRTTNEYSSE